MNFFCADIFNPYFIICKNATYAEYVFTTPSVRGQRTHSNAGTQKKLFKAKKAFPFDLYRGKKLFKTAQKTVKKLIKPKKKKSNK